MTVDPSVLPGLLLLAAELSALAAVGYVVVRVALRQDDERMALAQGLVVGPALWGLLASFVMYVVSGLAGAAVAWAITVAAGLALAWRNPRRIGAHPRTVAGFAVAVLALVFAALASRQLMGASHPDLHLYLAASIRAGGFPPELPWNPGAVLRYHFAPDLHVGLLAPPIGPDLAFVAELLAAYSWASFVFVVITALLRRASLIAVVAVAPLLLANGLWTWTSPAGGAILHIPVPAGLPGAGLPESLGDVYWPKVELAPNVRIADLLANIHKASYTMGYALTIIALEYAARGERWSWGASLTLAGLVGLLGMLAPSLVPAVLVVWTGLAVMDVLRARRTGSIARAALRPGSALVLAGLLLLVGGGTYTRILDGASSSGLELARTLNPGAWGALGTFAARPGGVGLLGVGPLAVAGLALALARRDRLVVALAAGVALLLLAWLALTYPPAPWDVNRFAGHARNLALVALLLAVTTRLADLRPTHRRYAAALVAVLVTWPTVVAPVRSLGLAIGHGVQLANARWVQEEFIDRGTRAPMRRFRMPPIAERVTDYIRDHTPVDARVLVTERPFWSVSIATGRPNHAGFTDLMHLIFHVGPEYLDATQYLEPAAIRHLGISYVHATDAWAAALPPRAQTWLGDPVLFELVVRDGRERLYRVRPAFLNLDGPPSPASFEALRQAVPSTALAYLVIPPLDVETHRVASTLSNAGLLGQVDPRLLHLLSSPSWRVDPLTDQIPDVVVLPKQESPWMFAPSARTPIWWNDDVAVYAPNGAVRPIMVGPPPAERPAADPPPVRMTVSDIVTTEGRLEFTATFDERDPQRWTSQDWVVLKGDRSPWAIPTEVYRRGAEPTIAKWFQGLLSAGGATTTHTYRFDTRVPELTVRNDAGAFVPLATSAADLEPGGYTLALRLRHEFQPNHWRDAAVIPVMRIRISEEGGVSYEVFSDVLAERVPIPSYSSP